MDSIQIEDVVAWEQTFGRIHDGIQQACSSERVEELLSWCDRIAKVGSHTSHFSEGDFLSFARATLAAAREDALGAALALNLTRVHCGVVDELHSSSRLVEVSEAALKSPTDHTSANRSFVGDMVYLALSRRTDAALDEGGVQAVVTLLSSAPFTNTDYGLFARRSIVHRLVHFSLVKDTAALSALGGAFEDDPGIMRDLAKVQKG